MRDAARAARVTKRFELPMLVIALLVIPAIVLEEASVSAIWKDVGQGLNWIIWIAFATELVVLLAVAPDRWRWVKQHPLDLAIVVLTPPFFPPAIQSARALRLLRVVRLVRLAGLTRNVFSLGGLRFAALLAGIAAFGGGAAFAEVEPGVSTWDGVYWSVTTMTTVGYGDLSPTTDTGKVISIVVMLVGIAFVAILTGAIAQRFLAGDVAEIEQATENVASGEHDLLAQVRTVAGQVRDLETALERQLALRPAEAPGDSHGATAARSSSS